ncbi:DUF4401 domain-containing protein [Citrifermentans bremense]|uniref:DUF4401 domain-containing protein n=1 Tax=Citrifermentans bremense TaxID=60035 RepID=UPI0003F83708|nr:DUF4401 domain-containing protein [Citrifermentans bremense]
MKTVARFELWGRLRQARLVTGDLPTAPSSPWYIRAMLGFAGWIGAWFILGFVGTGFAMVMRSAGAASFAAILCCGGAYAIFRLPSKGDFAGQFGLAVGLAGQALFAVAIFKERSASISLGCFMFFCIEALLTVLMPNFMHRIFTTVAAVAALFYASAQAGLHGVVLSVTAAACAVVWRGEMRLVARAELWQPVGYGLALGVLQLAASSAAGEAMLSGLHHGEADWLQRHGNDVGTALVAVIFLAVTVQILKELDIEVSGKEGIAIVSCMALIMAVSFPTHGLAAAALILILGFAGGNRVLFGLGLMAVASFLSHYYYQMRETLLIKSMILAATGALLLVARWALLRLIPAKEGRQDA